MEYSVCFLTVNYKETVMKIFVFCVLTIFAFNPVFGIQQENEGPGESEAAQEAPESDNSSNTEVADGPLEEEEADQEVAENDNASDAEEADVAEEEAVQEVAGNDNASDTEVAEEEPVNNEDDQEVTENDNASDTEAIELSSINNEAVQEVGGNDNSSDEEAKATAEANETVQEEEVAVNEASPENTEHSVMYNTEDIKLLDISKILQDHAKASLDSVLAETSNDLHLKAEVSFGPRTAANVAASAGSLGVGVAFTGMGFFFPPFYAIGIPTLLGSGVGHSVVILDKKGKEAKYGDTLPEGHYVALAVRNPDHDYYKGRLNYAFKSDVAPLYHRASAEGNCTFFFDIDDDALKIDYEIDGCLHETLLPQLVEGGMRIDERDYWLNLDEYISALFGQDLVVAKGTIDLRDYLDSDNPSDAEAVEVAEEADESLDEEVVPEVV